jgi:hypothetical protein
VSQTWDHIRSDLIRQADELLNADPDANKLIDLTAAWLRALLNGPLIPKSRDVLLHIPSGQTALPAALLAGGMPNWAHRVEALVTSQDPVMDLDVLAAERMLGTALGFLVGDKPEEGSFDFAANLADSFPGLWSAYWRSAQDALARNPSAPGRLRAMLQRDVEKFTAAPRQTLLFADSMDTSALIAAYRKAPLRDVWCNSPRGFMHLRRTTAYKLLLRLDPLGWLETIDKFPAPEPVAELVLECRPEDESVDMLSLLIERAPSPFGTNTEWHREHKAIFHLLQAAERQLATLAGPPSGGGNASAFQQVLDKITAVFAARPDASALGHAWLEELAWKDYATGHWRPHRDAWVVPDALFRLFMAIGRATPPLADPLIWIEGNDDTWRSDRLLAVLAVMHEQSAAQDVGRLLTEVASRGLSGGVERLLSQEATLASQVVGRAIARLPDQVAWLRDLWDQTFPLRDRARHLYTHRQGALSDPNILCIAWGLVGLEILDMHSAAAAQLWSQVNENAREARITIGHCRANDGHLVHAYRRLAILLPLICPPGALTNLADLLAAFLQSFTSPDLEFINLVLTLEGAGIPLDTIAAAVGGQTALRTLAARVLDDPRDDEGHRSNDRRANSLEALISRLEGVH